MKQQGIILGMVAGLAAVGMFRFLINNSTPQRAYREIGKTKREFAKQGKLLPWRAGTA